MPFDPAQPANNSALSSALMRSQLTSLKALIDAIVQITGAQVDNVSTLPPGDPAAANVTLVGDVLHFGFGIPHGAEGAQGPPFASAVVDGVTTVPTGTPASVSVSFDGTLVHFSFTIPMGETGGPGPQGPPGEVTNAQLTTAIATTALNPTAVTPLSQTADGTYNPTQMQQVMDKVDELLAAVKRP